jgi:hypothetical protein
MGAKGFSQFLEELSEKDQKELETIVDNALLNFDAFQRWKAVIPVWLESIKTKVAIVFLLPMDVKVLDWVAKKQKIVNLDTKFSLANQTPAQPPSLPQTLLLQPPIAPSLKASSLKTSDGQKVSFSTGKKVTFASPLATRNQQELENQQSVSNGDPESSKAKEQKGWCTLNFSE